MHKDKLLRLNFTGHRYFQRKEKGRQTTNSKKLLNMSIRAMFMIQIHNRMATLLPTSNSFTSMENSRGGKLYHQGYPDALGDSIVFSKTKRVFVKPTTHERIKSTEFSNAYFHFKFACIFAGDRCFAPQLIQIEQDVKMCHEEMHVITLSSAGIML